MSQELAAATEDKVWVEIATPLGIDALRKFCDDLECLYRINPYLDFTVWRQTGPDQHHIEFHNNSNDRDVTLDLTRRRESDLTFSVEYAQGIKAATRFALAATGQGSKLTITDDYSRLSLAERAQRLNEVDKSLTAWGQGVSDYLRHLKRWGWFPPWRWYMRRMWTPMRPMSRRVAWMVILVDVAFLALFLFVMLIYWVEFG